MSASKITLLALTLLISTAANAFQLRQINVNVFSNTGTFDQMRVCKYRNNDTYVTCEDEDDPNTPIYRNDHGFLDASGELSSIGFVDSGIDLIGLDMATLAAIDGKRLVRVSTWKASEDMYKKFSLTGGVYRVGTEGDFYEVQPSSFVGTLNDVNVPTATLSALADILAEGERVVVRVGLNKKATKRTVLKLSLSGSAKKDVRLAAKQIVIKKGESSADLIITAKPDRLIEDEEIVTITLKQPKSVKLSNSVVSIKIVDAN